jgi:hypothetical protein
MAGTFRYLGVDGEGNSVAAWFAAREPGPKFMNMDHGSTIYFSHLCPLLTNELGQVDPKRSPLVTHFPTRQRRSILWTVGEVHFLPRNVRQQFPQLDRIQTDFKSWLGQFEPVLANQKGPWDYYLEGSVRNYDSSVYGLPGAMATLRAGATYFVGDDDSDSFIDGICRKLSLRGVHCGQAELLRPSGSRVIQRR